MSVEAVVDPHEKMRARDVNKVARGEQAPTPAYEYGSTVSRAPSHPANNHVNKVVELKTSPNDVKFPFTNQTHHCYVCYLEYHKCIQVKGDNVPECENFAEYYRSLCPIERWNEQRANGTFPGPF
ncbi:cytochrome c oxidase subunit 6b-3-like [Juglans microcarpa x Juglans regia]|uniref:cytochrome c oxidase subunit 6b-3-like n=1 Tax=Juglans microcarpa x Juglans regia TaxID=2249226 RepID=UPI001B7E87E6|nr:cytochrome c oxidase subunit 6b-3-like [Juglans microcarpa x Juglans regia]